MALRISAIRRPDRQVVVAVDVAGGAWHAGVAKCQWKAGGVVIELCSQPTVKGVTRFAGGGELGGNVVRIRCLLKILQVTGRTRR